MKWEKLLIEKTLGNSFVCNYVLKFKFTLKTKINNKNFSVLIRYLDNLLFSKVLTYILDDVYILVKVISINLKNVKFFHASLRTHKNSKVCYNLSQQIIEVKIIKKYPISDSKKQKIIPCFKTPFIANWSRNLYLP